MNQPSAEELVDMFYSNTDEESDTQAFERILDRYHLINKTEPVSGAVTADEIRAMVLGTGRESTILEGCQKLIDDLDIYPKGTVARLRGEVADMKRINKDLHEETLELHLVESERVLELQAEVEKERQISDSYKSAWDFCEKAKMELQAELDKSILDWGDAITKAEKLEDEVDRLTSDNKKMARLLEGYSMTIDEQKAEILQIKKPEAVGCGKLWLTDSGFPFTCNHKDTLCPDCQDKATHNSISKNVTAPGYGGGSIRGFEKKSILPEVPNAKETNFGEWIDKAEKIMQAVKDWIEAQGEKE